MIKRYWQIDLRDFDIVEKTGNIGHLKKAWNILPVSLFVNRIAKELDELKKRLNAETNEDLKFQELLWQTQSLVKINAIRANYLGIVNILDLQNKLRALKKNKLKSKTGNLKIYLENIESLTGIKVETLKDIDKIAEELEYRIDKYKELINRKEVDPNKVYLMAIALGVYSFLNQTLNPHTTVLEFIEAKEMALEQQRKMKKHE